MQRIYWHLILYVILNINAYKIEILVNNVAVTNRNDIVNGFNEFFGSIGPELAKDIHSDINPLAYANIVNNYIAIFYVSRVEVRNIIQIIYYMCSILRKGSTCRKNKK